MKIRSLRIVLGIVVLALAQIACAAVTGGGEKPDPIDAPEVEPTAAPVKPAEEGACPAPKLAKTQPSGYVEKVVMARDTQGDNKDPVDPTTTFGPSDVFHAVVVTKEAPADTAFKAIWYADDTNGVADCETVIDEFELTTDGTRNIDFTLAPKESWPVGEFRVEIFVNGTLDKIVLFTVAE